MDDGTDQELTPWQETTGLGRQLAPRSGSSVAAEVRANLHNLKPSTADEIIVNLAPCLALVGGVGMSEEGRVEWLRAATETLRGIPFDLLRRGCDAAKRKADHPSKIVPAIMADIGDTWEWRRAQRSEPLDNRHVKAGPPPCTPEEAAEICRKFKVGSQSANRPARDPASPAIVPATADPDRACRMPSREDYIRLFGVDPEAPKSQDMERGA